MGDVIINQILFEFAIKIEYEIELWANIKILCKALKYALLLKFGD